MKNKNRLSILLSFICVFLIGILATYFAMQSFGFISTDKMPVEVNYNGGNQIELSKEYDADYIKIEDLKLDSNVKLMTGHSINYSIANNFCEVGSQDLVLTATIIDENKKDVTNEYDVKLPTIPFVINKRKLDVKLYNDKTDILTYKDYEIVEGSIVTGHSIKVRIENKKYIPFIVNPSGVDVTSNYDFTYKAQEVDQNKDKITLDLRYKAVAKLYDGKPLVPDFEIINGYLPSNRKIYATFITQENIDVSKVVLPINTTYTTTVEKIKVLETVGDSESDVTNEYNINLYNTYGNLTIDKRNIDIQFEDFKKDYDGKSSSYSDIKYKEMGLLKTHTIKTSLLNEPKKIIDAGKYELKFKVSIFDNEGNDITNAYNITQNNPILTINTIDLKLNFKPMYEGGKKVYDSTNLLVNSSYIQVLDKYGQPHMQSDLIISTLDIKFNYQLHNNVLVDSICDAGIYKITIKSIVSNNTNYKFDYSNALMTYTVDKQNINFAFNETLNSITYNGYEQDFANYKEGYTITGLLPGDVVKPSFNYLYHDGKNYVKEKFYNAGKYKIVFDGFEFINVNPNNYNTVCVSDTITIDINPYELFYQEVTETIEYDGKEHTIPVPKLVSNLLGNDSMTINANLASEVGDHNCTDSSYVFVNSLTRVDVTDNYVASITTTARLIIKPRVITVVTDGANFTINQNTSFINAKFNILNILDKDLLEISSVIKTSAEFIDLQGLGVGIFDNIITNQNTVITAVNGINKNYELKFEWGKVVIKP